MIDEQKVKTGERKLFLVEFMQMCADSGFINEATAQKICLFAKNQGGIEAIPAFPGELFDNETWFTDILAYTPSDERSFDNYVVTDDNSYGVELARTVALIPRIWKSISPILFHAGTGQGKTHLLSAIATTSRQNSLFLNLNDLKMGYRRCKDTNKESQLLSWITSHNLLLLDDLQFVRGDIEFQHFLCSVFNRMPTGKSAIVLCSNTEAESLQDLDSTFYSRISSGISVELKAIDFRGRVAILEKMFSNTGFGPGADVVNYIATGITQNVRTLKAAGRAVLAYLLATPSREPITIEKVTSLLNSMNLYSHTDNDTVSNIPENTSEKENKADSPYIVVEINDEPDPITGDELKFKQAIEKGKKRIEVQPGKAEDKSSREESISMIENATTVNSQIAALKMAAEMRIRQLETKNPNSPEIAKLRFAIVFLDQGKVESAMLALK
ncbi:MAG: ATP-binding protein [Candidatus Sabulitectum sp.]|nr:ATP-binding protein [Candidatus Sabulitectum sp.]